MYTNHSLKMTPVGTLNIHCFRSDLIYSKNWYHVGKYEMAYAPEKRNWKN